MLFGKMKMRSSIVILGVSLLCLVLSSCASVNSVSLTPIPANRSREVRAEVSKTIFLAFNFDNDYVEGLVTDLKRQCPNGIVSGILTKDETISYFLVFTKRIVATGFCNSSVARVGKAGRSTASEDPVTETVTGEKE